MITNENEFDQLLAQLRKESDSNQESGARFETLMCQALPLLDVRGSRYRSAMRWTDWYHTMKSGDNIGAMTQESPEREYSARATGQDTGIDLVAEIAEEYGGGYCAVQCKCYNQEHPIDKKSIDSFISDSGRSIKVGSKYINFSERLIITTSDNWTKNADVAIEGQNPSITRLGLSELRHNNIRWMDFEKRSLRVTPSDTKPFRHQKQAIGAALAAFQSGETRGKLIMACGTGKTYTALKIAEGYAGLGGRVLFLTPSISLLSQSIGGFFADRAIPHLYLAVCSDSRAGRATSTSISSVDIPSPPTTKPEKIAQFIDDFNTGKQDSMLAIFSTYQSLAAVGEAQKILMRRYGDSGRAIFDLIICDEAHRTVGASTFIDREMMEPERQEAHFTKAHSDENVAGRRRLYMTATPRVYAPRVKTRAAEIGAAIYSMDDEDIYGKEIFRYSFSQAVTDNMLSDYHVHILCMKSAKVSLDEISAGDAVKMAGCWKAIHRPPAPIDQNRSPMKRVVAFCARIATSKHLKEMLPRIAREAAIRNKPKDRSNTRLRIEHVDGAMNALERSSRLDWLRGEPDPGTCRILTNARCLSEGIDVPSLDGIIFYDRRKSHIDIVQAVGRVMRKAKDKRVGNIILPVALPDGADPDTFLKKDAAYTHIWQVLSALRSHDERFEEAINKMEFNQKLPSNVTLDIVSHDAEDEELSAVERQLDLAYPLSKWIDALIPRFIERCGDRLYWSRWAKDVSDIAKTIIALIGDHIQKDSSFNKAFEQFTQGLRKTINDLITKEQAMQAIAQHIITKPVFDALFKGYEFSRHNAISLSMDDITNELRERGIDNETKTLEVFYRDVAKRAENIDTLAGKQNIMERLYNEFFQEAFQREAQQAGIVYTPVEIVDFINHSVDWLLKRRFWRGIDRSKGAYSRPIYRNRAIYCSVALFRFNRQTRHGAQISRGDSCQRKTAPPLLHRQCQYRADLSFPYGGRLYSVYQRRAVRYLSYRRAE